MRRRLKQALKRPVARLLELYVRCSGRRTGLALCYHRIGDPEGDLEHELVPALGTARFEAQIRYLRSRYRVVRASELHDAALERRRGRRLPVAITFDDDLSSHLSDAMPILRRVGVPATFFLCGASLERPHGFWWERLQRAWNRGVVDERILERLGGTDTHSERVPIRRVAAAIEELPAGRRDALAEELRTLVGPDPEDAGLRAPDVARLAEAGFEIGFHTRRHDRLPALNDRSLVEAMTDGKADLERAVGSSIGAISYPHGVSDRRVADAARAAGYRFGFAAMGRAIVAPSDPLLLDRRYPVNGNLGDFVFDVSRALWVGPTG
jgi:peptidoglycan/xylan/chitin deacetylase (PgdA/CDA1 family)